MARADLAAMLLALRGDHPPELRQPFELLNSLHVNLKHRRCRYHDLQDQCAKHHRQY